MRAVMYPHIELHWVIGPHATMYPWKNCIGQLTYVWSYTLDKIVYISQSTNKWLYTLDHIIVGYWPIYGHVPRSTPHYKKPNITWRAAITMALSSVLSDWLPYTKREAIGPSMRQEIRQLNMGIQN
jgi:hypothetical protein